MQQNYNVIAKGEYAHKQTNDFLHVERFLIIRKKARRLLLLDFNNLSRETLTSLQLSIEQFDGRGNFLGEVIDEIKKTTFKSGKFILKRAIALERGCMDIRVKILRAQYGNYAYCLGEQGTYTIFERPKKWKKLQNTAVEQKTGEEGRMQNFRRFKPPIFVSIVAAFVLVASLVAGIIHVSSFSRDEDEFFLSNIRYRYVDGVKDEGSPVYAIGAIGQGGRNLYIPNEVEGHPVVKVEMGSFYRNSIMHEITIAQNVEIEARAFAECPNLEKITLEGNNVVEEYAFSNCQSLKNITINEAAIIGFEAFAYADQLKTLEINGCAPNYTTAKISKRAFASCGSAFNEIEEIKVDAYVSYNTDEAIFESTNNVKKVYLKNYNSANYEKSITKSLSPLFGYALYNIKEVEIDYADCIPAMFMKDASNVQKVTIHHLTSSEIGAEAFKDCKELTTLTLPKKVTALGDNAFSATKLSTFDVSSVERLGSGVFSNCAALTRLDFGTQCQLTALPDETFKGCSALTSFVIPSTMRSVGQYAFASCSSLASVTFPAKLETLNDYAFFDCDSLTSITLPSEITYFGTGAFEHCTSLQSVVLSDGIPYVGANAFANCNALTSVEIPKTVSQICSGAFNGCASLPSIDLPEGVSIVEPSAFQDCIKLEKVYLPTTLMEIQDMAFYNCIRLHEVYNFSTLPITTGFSDFGMVAENALAVHTDRAEHAAVETVKGFVFKIYGNDCALVDYTGTAVDLELGSLRLSNGSWLSSYKVFRGAFTEENESIKSVTLTGAVSEWRDRAFVALPNLSIIFVEQGVQPLPNNLFLGCTSVSAVILPKKLNVEMSEFTFYDAWVSANYYYEGTRSDWVRGGYFIASDMTYCNIYYTADCIHRPDEWNYTMGGAINTTQSRFETEVLKSPTCRNEGVGQDVCTSCGYRREKHTLYSLGHDYDYTYMECKRCGYINGFYPNKQTLERFEDLVKIKNDKDNPFNIYEKEYNAISAPDKKDISSTLKFTAREDIIISFEVSSWVGKEIKFTVKGDGNEYQVSQSSQWLTFHLSEGESLTIKYVDNRDKDDEYTPQAYIANISITHENEPR